MASLQVDRAAVRAELARVQAQRNYQYDRWAMSHIAAEQAKDQFTHSALLAVKAQQMVVAAQERVRDYAVQAFINPPAVGSIAVLAVEDAKNASWAHDVLSITADDQSRVVDELASAEQTAKRRVTAAQQAADDSTEKESASKTQLDALEASVQTQRNLNAQVSQRLDGALAEVAALREVDQAAADEMEKAEIALADETKAALGDTSSATSSSGSDAPVSTASSPSPSPGTTSPPVTTKPKPKPKPTTQPTPTPSPPSSVVTWQDVTKVGTFWVNKSIASRVQGLLSAASGAGFNLTGGGFRDPASQIALRKAHCGPTYYDIYQRPAGECSPPTAIPGRSMHEQGLALDIKSGGALITSHSNPAFVWLNANAARFGFYNLPSEPWHWSVNGH